MEKETKVVHLLSFHTLEDSYRMLMENHWMTGVLSHLALMVHHNQAVIVSHLLHRVHLSLQQDVLMLTHQETNSQVGVSVVSLVCTVHDQHYKVNGNVTT